MGTDRPGDDRKREFAAIMSPVYVLTVGNHSADDKRAWMAAAYEALSHVPFDILRIGAKAAALKVSHPAKIIPTIMDEIADPLRWRRERSAAEPLRLTHRKEDRYEAGPLERELLDRMEGAPANSLLGSLRQLGITNEALYIGDDGKLYNTVAAGG